jgi:hypothetical protein
VTHFEEAELIESFELQGKEARRFARDSPPEVCREYRLLVVEEVEVEGQP